MELQNKKENIHNICYLRIWDLARAENNCGYGNTKVYKRHECMSTYDSINEKAIYLYDGIYPALKRNEVVIHAMTRMNGNSML